MKLRAKFILAFLIIVLFIAVVGRINARLGSQAMRTYDAIVDEFVPVVIGLGNVKAALLRVQREIYSNILIENESDVFQLANQRQQKWQNDYFLKSEKPEDKQIVYEINKTETAVYQLGIDLIQEKKKGSQIGLKRTKERLDQAADRLNSIVDKAIEQRIEKLQEGARIAEAAGDRTLNMTYVIVAASALFAIAVGFLLARSVVVPIARLKDAAEKLGKGDLSSRVTVHSKDELGVLAESFNRMAENMDQSSRRLQLARDEAERANRLKSEFMRNTSHELRTPMAIIMGMNDLVLDAELSPEQKECALAIRKASQNLSHLINDMLDFSKGSYGQLSLKAVPFDLYKACEKVTNAAMNEAKGKGLSLTLQYADRAPRQVVGDPGRMIQILTILLSNAIKFTEKGQVRLEVDGRQDKVGEAVFFFSVVDTGIGIAKENLGHIFEELTQLDGSTTRRYGGLGLGLSICMQLVQLIKGKMTAESELGKGSVFRVRAILPLAAPHQEGSGEAKSAVKQSILISALLWDSQDADQRLEKRMLEELGCSVDVAPTMEDAVKMLRESPYDVFFMARPAGELEWIRQYIEQCRMGSLSRNLAIIGMITDSRVEEREFNLELTSLLKKPITYKDFEKILEGLA